MDGPINGVYFPISSVKTVKIGVDDQIFGRNREPIKIFRLVVEEWVLGDNKLCEILNLLQLIGGSWLLLPNVQNSGEEQAEQYRENQPKTVGGLRLRIWW